MTSDPETLKVYAEKAEHYAKTTKEWDKHPDLLSFIELMPPGGRVLDLGCGPGTAASGMAKAGLVVDATDASPEFVEMASALAGVSARLEAFADLSETDTYDGIFANFSLLHAPKSDFPDHLLRIRKALIPGGLFQLTLKAGEGEHRDSFGRFYAYYQEDELDRLLTAANLTPKDRWSGKIVGLTGDVEPWITMRARA